MTTLLFYILVQQQDTKVEIDYLADERQPLILSKKAGQKIERKRGVHHVEDILVVPEAEEVLNNYSGKQKNLFCRQEIILSQKNSFRAVKQTRYITMELVFSFVSG